MPWCPSPPHAPNCRAAHASLRASVAAARAQPEPAEPDHAGAPRIGAAGDLARPRRALRGCVLGVCRRRAVRRGGRVYRKALRSPHPARGRARSGRRQGAADRPLRHAVRDRASAGLAGLARRSARRADRARLHRSAGERRAAPSRPALYQQDQYADPDRAGRLRAGAARGRGAGRVGGSAADRRGGDHDGAVGLVLSCCAGAASSAARTGRREPEGRPSAVLDRPLSAGRHRPRPGSEHPDAVRGRLRDRLRAGAGCRSPRADGEYAARWRALSF